MHVFKIKHTNLMLDVLTLFFVCGIINSFEGWLTNFFRMSVAHLIWNSSCYWMEYLLWNCMALGFVFMSILGDGNSFTDTFRDIFAFRGVGSIINGVAFNNGYWLRMMDQGSSMGRESMEAMAKPWSIWMVGDTFSNTSVTPGLGISFSFSLRHLFCQSQRHKKAQGNKNLE